MKKWLMLIAISIMLCGCIPSTNLSKSSKYMSPSKVCNFDSIPGLTFKLTTSTPKFSLYVHTSPDKYSRANFMSRYTQNALRGKLIKIVSFEQQHDRYNLLDEYELFLANGKKHILINGLFKGITQDCYIVYLEASGVLNNELLTKPNSLPLDGNDKLSIAKNFNDLIEKLDVSIDEDEFEGNKWIKTPNIDDTFLRALIDLRSNKLVFIQIYSTTSHYAEWAHLDRAKDKQQKSFELVKIDHDVDCSGSLGCIMYETIGINISLNYLKSHHDGIEIQASGRKGKSLIYVPAKSINLMIKALEKQVNI